MEIKQFNDHNLAHYSYAIISNGEMALIDPARNPQPYYDYANAHNSKITTIIETHPHADFVSSHLEIHNTKGATIYVSKLLGAEYPHQTFDDGDSIVLGKINLKAINTPGHSPDSISIVAINEDGKYEAVFTGDTLFIGDCGRPDLRETAGTITANRIDLAKQMYHSLRSKLMLLPEETLVYPAHGAGSLCGKGLSSKNTSTIGAEKISNWSLQEMSEADFVTELLANQAYIPKYFTYNVELNKKGATPFEAGVAAVPKQNSPIEFLNPNIIIIDTRPQDQFKKSHLKGAINLMNDTKFESWLGSIVNPYEKFYLIAENEMIINELIQRIAKIGYENQIELGFTLNTGDAKSSFFDSKLLNNIEEAYTIVDIRSNSEVNSTPIFDNALNIPLNELRERTNEIPTHKPILVHCAGGYRSAAGSSIIKANIAGTSEVFDLSEDVKKIKK